jgi:hypothetical protein
VAEIFVVILLDFPDLDKVCRTSTIDDLFLSFINVCLPRIVSMLKGIDYLSKLYAKNLRQPKLPYVDADEDQARVTIFFHVVPLLT